VFSKPRRIPPGLLFVHGFMDKYPEVKADALEASWPRGFFRDYFLNIRTSDA